MGFLYYPVPKQVREESIALFLKTNSATDVRGIYPTKRRRRQSDSLPAAILENYPFRQPQSASLIRMPGGALQPFTTGIHSGRSGHFWRVIPVMYCAQQIHVPTATNSRSWDDSFCRSGSIPALDICHKSKWLC